jgi:hypothetical protein
MPSMDERESLPAGDATGRPDASGAPRDVVAVAASAKNRARGMRTPQRARRKQQQAAAVGQAGESPGFGAVNRQLETVLQQLATTNRLLGRVAAERDALRQQLADLQGIPVEEIVVPSVGASSVPTESGPQRDAAPAEASEGRIDRIRRRLPGRWRNQNSPRS